jgi:hypothetical protein
VHFNIFYIKNIFILFFNIVYKLFYRLILSLLYLLKLKVDVYYIIHKVLNQITALVDEV